MKITKQQLAIGVLILFCTVTFLVRIYLTKSMFFGFLLWNIFLATIPFIVSECIKRKKNQKIMTIFLFFIWLLFLPNAPYLITDFIHLHHLKSTLIWYDLFMLFCFAFTGVLLGIISAYDVYNIIKLHFQQSIANKIIIFVFFLSGLGIYLGRFLRLNSWDLFTKPLNVLHQILASFSHNKAWLVTFGFGSLFWVLFFVYKSLLINEEKK